jgi:hypothetical protein
MKRILILATVVLPLAGCQNPNGSTNWGNTLLMGAGTGVAGGVLGGLINDGNHNNRYYRGGGGGYGYGGGGGYGYQQQPYGYQQSRPWGF